MVIKINTDTHNLKIGITGTRYRCFENILKKYRIKFNYVNIEDIDSSYDLIFESGVYTIIPDHILQQPKYGIIGIHETPLPMGKGHAPLQWTILNKRRNLTVTLYKLNQGIDTGEIIHQINIPVTIYDTLIELNKKRLLGIEKVFECFINELIAGYIVLRKQTGQGTYHKKRNKDSCELNSEMKLKDLWDNIRICDNNDYPAWFRVGNRKVILRYEVLDEG